MKRLILIAAISALALAKPKPETYKETEDFQYSRSSSDDGTKSGFYGAQRGNMGGNYERAHNMDTLAQHQMSGLVRQVDGELGEGAKTRTGSVYTAANSRGIYGSGKYDLSNLQGRNFAEGESVGNSQSHLSQSSHNSRYGSQSYSGMDSSAGISSSHSHNSRYSGYGTQGHAEQSQTDNLQAVDTSQGLGRYESNNQAGYNMKYHTQSGSHGRSEFDQSIANHHSSSGYDANLQSQYITTPVKVVLRPGGRVAIPISAPTYAVSQNALQENDAINSDAEVLNQHAGLKPTNKAKHYEASYSYRKQWEKHHSLPGDISVVVPTENPFPKNSELYEDAELLQSSKRQLHNANLQTVDSSNINSDQRAYTKSADSSQSRFQGGYNSQHSQSGLDSQRYHAAGFNSQQSQLGLSPQQSQSGLSSQQSQSGLSAQQGQLGVSSRQSQSSLRSHQNQLDYNVHQSHFGSQQSRASTGTHANAYGLNTQISGAATDLSNAGIDINSKPKSYHSSYSYHKSWERQGDPYVIKPVGNVYDGKNSERLTAVNAAASSNNAAYSSHQFGSHSRQTHQSYSADCDDQGHIRVARSYNTDQELEQNQNEWEDLGQETQNKFENLEDLGQQQQNKWDNLEDLGQQTQNQWDNLQQQGQETQNQWDNLQQLGQETQNQWDNLQQLGQQTQDKWDNLEDLGQQTHRDLDQHQSENHEAFGQQSQKDLITNFEQQATNENQDVDVLGQQNQKHVLNFEHQVNNQKEIIGDINQQTQKDDTLTNFEQQANNENEILDVLSQHNQQEQSLTNYEQQVNTQQENLDGLNQYSQQEQSLTNFEQQANTQQENLDGLRQHSQKEQSLTNYEQQVNTQQENLDGLNQYSQQEQSLTNFEQQANTQQENLDGLRQHNQKEQSLTNYEQQANSQQENLDGLNQYSQPEQPLTNFEQQANTQQENLDSLSQQEQSLINIEQQANIQNENKLTKYEEQAYTPKQHPFNVNSWDQTSGLNYVYDQNNNKHNLFGQSHDNRLEDKSITQSDKQNLFPMTSSDTEHNKLWHEDKGENILWNITQNQNINHHFNNLNEQYDTGNPLKGLWDKIDNIVGESIATEHTANDKKQFSDDSSEKKYINQMQNGYSWSYIPTNTNIDTTDTNTDKDSENKKNGHNLFDEETENKKNGHNLFDEETENKSTTVSPTLLSQSSPRPEENATTTTINSYIANHKNHSQDEGRGDIGPEETPIEVMTSDTSKPHNIQQEIETLSLRKEVNGQKKDDFIIHSSSIKNIDENTDNKFMVTNSIKLNNTENKQYDLFSILQFTTKPSVQTSTTIRNNKNSVQATIQPTLGILDISNNPLSGLQVPQQQTEENVEIPEDIPQQNLEPQNEDFGQLQVQSSWFPTTNLQQAYDQQDVDQQFEVLHQQKYMEEQNYLQDFGQQLQNFSPLTRDVQNTEIQHENPQQYQVKESLSSLKDDKPKLQPSAVTRDTTENTQKYRESEPLHVSNYNDQNLQDSQKNEYIPKTSQSPPEIVTEKPGFWKSLGNKLSSAKNKVHSWFTDS